MSGCVFCKSDMRYGAPLLDGEYDYAYIDVPAKQLVTIRYDGDCDDPPSHEVYVNIRHCPMCGKRL